MRRTRCLTREKNHLDRVVTRAPKGRGVRTPSSTIGNVVVFSRNSLAVTLLAVAFLNGYDLTIGATHFDGPFQDKL